MRAMKRKKTTRWVAALLGSGLLFAGLILLTGHDGIMGAIQRALAVVASGILNGLGQNTEVVGTTVQSDVFGINVVTACTGMFLIGLFLMAVVAFPTRWRAKLIGSAIGVGGILLVNVVRLVSLYFIGVHWPDILDQVHQLIWQSLLIVVAVALWLLWAGRWAHAHAKQ
jgi:archaeosortase B (VPXXXP-CTERM-specific)